jgi:LmbE family N-acetylglucosaminyl deacetylase
VTPPTRKRILFMTARPDDADIMAGGTIARWIDEGHEVHSVMFTRGDKGHDDPAMTCEELALLRLPRRSSDSSPREGHCRAPS